MKRLLVVAVLSSLAVAGCGSSGGEGPASTPSPVTSTTAPVPLPPEPTTDTAAEAEVPPAPAPDEVSPGQVPVDPMPAPAEPAPVIVEQPPEPQPEPATEFVPVGPSQAPIADDAEITCDTPCTTTGCEQYKYSVLGCP